MFFDSVGFGDFPHSPDLVNGERIHSDLSHKRMNDLATIKRWAHRLSVIPGAARSFSLVFCIRGAPGA